jgi:hypothetical protein
MKFHQLADSLDAKTFQLIEIAKALELSGLPNPHGGTSLTRDQAQQITATFRYMRDRQIVDPKAATTQIQAADSSTEEIAISLRVSVADELCRRYPDRSMSDRILMLLGALQAFEQLHKPYGYQGVIPLEVCAITALTQPTPCP